MGKYLLWDKLVTYEKSNPLELQSKELHERVKFVYNQWLLCFTHYPDIWIEAANYFLQTVNDAQLAEKFYKNAIKLSPNSALIYFAYANYLEERNKTTEAERIYDQLIENSPTTLAFIQKMKFKKRTMAREKIFTHLFSLKK